MVRWKQIRSRYWDYSPCVCSSPHAKPWSWWIWHSMQVPCRRGGRRRGRGSRPARSSRACSSSCRWRYAAALLRVMPEESTAAAARCTGIGRPGHELDEGRSEGARLRPDAAAEGAAPVGPLPSTHGRAQELRPDPAVGERETARACARALGTQPPPPLLCTGKKGRRKGVRVDGVAAWLVF
jgi:hypothetical protein